MLVMLPAGVVIFLLMSSTIPVSVTLWTASFKSAVLVAYGVQGRLMPYGHDYCRRAVWWSAGVLGTGAGIVSLSENGTAKRQCRDGSPHCAKEEGKGKK